MSSTKWWLPSRCMKPFYPIQKTKVVSIINRGEGENGKGMLPVGLILITFGGTFCRLTNNHTSQHKHLTVNPDDDDDDVVTTTDGATIHQRRRPPVYLSYYQPKSLSVNRPNAAGKTGPGKCANKWAPPNRRHHHKTHHAH